MESVKIETSKIETSKIIEKLNELNKDADYLAYSGEYGKAAGMYRATRELWAFLRIYSEN